MTIGSGDSLDLESISFPESGGISPMLISGIPSPTIRPLLSAKMLLDIALPYESTRPDDTNDDDWNCCIDPLIKTLTTL